MKILPPGHSLDPTYWKRQGREALRVLLSYYVLNGAVCAFGLFLISTTMQAIFGPAAAVAAMVGVISTIPPDIAAPVRGKASHMAMAPLLGLPLFLAVQLLRPYPIELGLLLVPATFIAFLGMAWGKRGAPVAIAVVFAMIFSMSTPIATDMGEALLRSAYFALGAAMYVVYSVATNALCNARYRTQLIADLLFSVAALLHAQAQRFTPQESNATAAEGAPQASNLGELLRLQAALADQIQNTRDVVLESPRTPRRQRLAGMLLTVLEMRDQLVASELDLDQVRTHAGHREVLIEVREILHQMAVELDALADSLLLGRAPFPATNHNGRLETLRLGETTEAESPHDTETFGLLRGVTYRLVHLNNAVKELTALARAESMPDLTVVRNNWRLFVSPTDWSWRPFLSLLAWRAPPLRHAIRAALAIGTGYAIATMLPWGSHAYWVLLTIVVVLRGSLAQTLERRDARVAGTVLGSLLAVGLLAIHPPAFVLQIGRAHV